MSQTFVLEVNPQPWEIGPLSVGRKGSQIFPRVGKATEMANYQEAIRSELARLYPNLHKYEKGTELSVEMYFSRNIGEYVSLKGRKAKDHVCDATNMQKSTEDALQGVLFDNDRENRFVSSCILAQSTEAAPLVIIKVDCMALRYRITTGTEMIWKQKQKEYEDGSRGVLRSGGHGGVEELEADRDSAWPPAS